MSGARDWPLGMWVLDIGGVVKISWTRWMLISGLTIWLCLVSAVGKGNLPIGDVCWAENKTCGIEGSSSFPGLPAFLMVSTGHPASQTEKKRNWLFGLNEKVTLPACTVVFYGLFCFLYDSLISDRFYPYTSVFFRFLRFVKLRVVSFLRPSDESTRSWPLCWPAKMAASPPVRVCWWARQREQRSRGGWSSVVLLKLLLTQNGHQ